METEVKKIPKRRWTHIIPVCILVYIVAFMDRTNISFAIAGGMSEALNLTASMSGLASGIFFIGYMVLQIPGGNMAEHGSAKKFISFSIIAWSIFAIVEGFVHNSTQLLILRFCLGVAEGGVWPAILVIITHWFPMEERKSKCFLYHESCCGKYDNWAYFQLANCIEQLASFVYR